MGRTIFPQGRCTMAVKVKPVALWRREIEKKPGAVANVLENLRNVDLQVVMAYRYPGTPDRGAVEAYPIAGKKTVQAAQAAGLSASTIPALLVEGDNKAGLACAITKALSVVRINLEFVLSQVVGRKQSTVIGFESVDDARKAVPLIRKA